MRKLLSTTFAAMLFTSSAFAANQTFFAEDVRPGAFYVMGVTADAAKGKNPACYAEVNYGDGSQFQLIRDLADGELYIWLHNAQWNIRDVPGSTANLRANFRRSNGQVESLTFTYKQVNSSTIIIRGIFKDRFLPLFTGSQKMTFAMPGTIQDAEVELLGSSRAVSELSRCVDASAGIDLYPDNRSTTPRRYDNI